MSATASEATPRPNAASGATGREVEVRIPQGVLRGVREGDTEVFRGVPYGAPPVGDLRWRPPQPAPGWDGVRDAAVDGSAAVQPPIPMGGGPLGMMLGPDGIERTGEDCLHVVVRRPAGTAPGAALPVMVWCHGGSFRFGHGAQPGYAGAALVARGVVLVNVTHRLGALGFLAHPELTAEDPGGSSGNYGALDIVQALRWVRGSIAAFGGDPDRVTLFGESSGAATAVLAAGSPLAAGLVHRVISQSGSFFGPPGPPVPEGTGASDLLLADAERIGTNYLERLGVTSIAQARDLAPEQVLAAGDTAPGEMPLFLRPCVDGWFLPEPTYRMLAAGRWDALPVIAGTTADEGGLFVPPDTSAEQFRASLAAWGESADEVRAAYPAGSDAEAPAAARDLQRDATFAWPAWEWARVQAGHGGAPVWVYDFDRHPPFPHGTFESFGALHGAELPYVFGTLDSPAMRWDAADRELSEVVVGYWTAFAATGDPNAAGLPRWPACSAGDESSMHFGERAASGPVTGLDRLRVLDTSFARRNGADPA